MLWRLKMLYFWEDLGAFGRVILIWCFKRFKNDRCSCSLDEVQIKPQRGVNERYFRIKKNNNKILVLSVKHNHISRGRVVTEVEWWKAELFLRNLCTWGKMSNILPPQLVLIHNLLWIIRSECVLLCSAHKGVGLPTESFIVLSMALKRNFFMEYFIVSLRSHDLKSTVLVDIVRRPLMPLYLKEVLVYADTVKYLRFYGDYF